jgi:hypothetical protein
MDSIGTNAVPSGQLWYIASLVGTMTEPLPLPLLLIPLNSTLPLVGKLVPLVALLLLLLLSLALLRPCSMKDASSVEEGDTSSTLLSNLELE